MKKVLKTIGIAAALAIALGINIAVLIGYLPVSVAAILAVIITIIVTTTAPAGSNHRRPPRINYLEAAPEPQAARIGETYVITGKSIHNNSGKPE